MRHTCCFGCFVLVVVGCFVCVPVLFSPCLCVPSGVGRECTNFGRESPAVRDVVFAVILVCFGCFGGGLESDPQNGTKLLVQIWSKNGFEK